MNLELQQVLGPNTFLRQHMMPVHAILNALRTGTTPLTGLPPTLPIPFREAVIIWAFAYITPRKIFPQDAFLGLVQMYPVPLMDIGRTYGKILEKDPLAQLPPRVIAIADRRLVSITGVKGCFDLMLCQRLDEAPTTFEGISYNLALPARKEWLRTQQGAKDDQRPDPETIAGPQHAGNRPASTGFGLPGTEVRGMGPPNNQHGDGGGARSAAAATVLQQAYGGGRASHQ